MPFRKNSRYRVERVEIRFQGLEPPGRFKVVARVPVSDIDKNRFIQGFGQTRFIIRCDGDEGVNAFILYAFGIPFKTATT
jgi:hypothetical protein